MAFFLSGCLLLGLLTLYVLTKIFNRNVYKYPPGPKGLPLIGSLLDISPQKSHLQYTELTEKYGDIISVNLAGKRVVVLNSSEVIRDAFVSEETSKAFSGRPDSFYVRYCDPGPSTAFSDYSDVWKLQRQFLVKTLKVFGEGKHQIERTITDELDVGIQKIRETQEKPFNIKEIILPCLANILLILIGGKRYESEDPTIKAALALDQAEAKLLNGHVITVLTMFPFLRNCPGYLGDFYHEFKQGMNDVIHYVFDPQKATFDPLVRRGYLDELFALQADNPWLKDGNIKAMIVETIGAGLGTTRGTLMAFFLLMLHHPNIMKKIQAEIDEVVGMKRKPSVFDRGKMPYTEAVVMETSRYVTVVPMAVPHTTTHDVHFLHYFFPKGTLVFPNLWAAHHSEKIWGDPWMFRPERFLNPDGTLKPIGSKERHTLIPFGVGKRACLGETFARVRIFLFMTTLLQQFDFRPCASQPLPSYDPSDFDPGITIHAPQFKLIASARKSANGV